MRFLLSIIMALSVMAGSFSVQAQPTRFTQKYGTDLPGAGVSLFGPVFTNRKALTAPANTVAPVASGTARVGETLTTTDGTWSGTAPITYTYQWRRDGVNIGSATNSTYVLVMADLGTVIDCNVTATNAAGNATQDSNNIAVGADLGAVLASAVFDLDATKAASYTSGTTWANLVTAPADGSAQTAYDFYTGDGATSTTYPTFNGSAGSSAAYWSSDGGDYFRLKSGTNTTFLKNTPKTTGGENWWFAITFLAGNDSAAVRRIFNMGPDFVPAGSLSVFVGTTDLFSHSQRGSAAVTVTDSTVTATNTYILIVSHNHSTNQTTWWVNSSTGTSVSHTYSTNTTDAPGPMTLCAESDGGFPLPANTRIYSAAMGNEYLDNTKAAAIISALEARHGRDYTP